MKKVTIGLLLVVSVLLAACSNASSSSGNVDTANEDKIVGKWVDSDGEIFEFDEDGTCRMIIYGNSMDGHYEFYDAGTMYLDIPGSIQYAVEVSFQGDEMTISLQGDLMVFERRD